MSTGAHAAPRRTGPFDVNELAGRDRITRHPATRHLLSWFSFEHLRPGPARDVARLCAEHARHMVALLDDGAELTAGLRKLLEAKDCLVRQALERETA